MKISAIILTYNQPAALELILKSIVTQKLIPDEVIIADDGSTSETTKLITKLKKKFPTKLEHVWHEDKGFRTSAIRNKAIKKSTGDCLIFSDGDLIFHTCFFYDFKKNTERNMALIGSRTFLKKTYSEKISENKTLVKIIPLISFAIERNRLNSIRIPMLSYLFNKISFTENLRGGLIAVWKKDIIRINGWNEDFMGWGKEDTEFAARLSNSGVNLRKLKFSGITYHLWHPILNRSKLDTNDSMLAKCIRETKMV